MRAKKAFVYIVRCADDTYYTGTARDVARRLGLHNARRGAKYTRPRVPVRLVYQEGPMSLTKALRREYQLKQLTRRKKEALIAGKLVVRMPGPRMISPRKKRPAASSVDRRGRAT